jgi:hypothetical protein
VRARAFVAALGAAGSLSASALGAPLTATISVEASSEASDCPDREQLTREVEHILHRSLGSTADSGPALEVSVRFSRARDGYTALVRSLGPKPGERELRDRGASCAALAEAASVAIALLLDKELAEPSTEPAPSPAPAPAPAAPPIPIASKPMAAEGAASSAPSQRHFELRPSFELGASTGLGSAPAAIGTLGLGVRLERALTLDLLVAAESARSTEFAAGSVRTSLLLVALRGCYRWGNTVAVGPCLTLARGWLTGEGVGYAAAQSAELRWLGAGAGVVAEGPVWGRLSWLVTGTLWLPLQRSSFSLENGGTAWESSRLAGTLGAGLAFALW